MQPRFIKWLIPLAFVAALERDASDERPNRTPRGPALAEVRLVPLPLPVPAAGDIRVGGLADLRSPEPRFGGLSGLATSGGEFVAISDSGVAIRWPIGGGTGRFRDLPDGPGRPEWKIHRDSEALLADPRVRGWWVTFEQDHQLWLFDAGFTRRLARHPVPLRTWWRNWGLEAAVPVSGGLLLLPENAGTALRWREQGFDRVPLSAPAQIADAVPLPDGRVVVALRSIRPWGIVNRLGWLRASGESYAVEPWGRLPLGRWDNVEGLTAEARPDGATRLWFVTDSDFRRRTLLGWVEIATDRSRAPKP